MNKHITLSLLPLLLLTACGSHNKGVTILKDCLFYYNAEAPDRIDLYFFDESKDIPYVEILPWMDAFLNGWKVSRQGEIFTVYDNRDCESYYINADTTEITFENYDYASSYLSILADTDPFDKVEFSLFNVERVKEESSYTKGDDYSVKLKDFGFSFKKYNDKYFAPIDLVRLLSLRTGSFYFDDHGLYPLPYDERLKDRINFNKTFSSLYYEHCFNVYSLTQELFNGLKGVTRKMLGDGSNHVYFEKGVLATLSPYKESIVKSKSIEEFDKNMMIMLKTELNSGGHDNCAGVSFADKQAIMYASEYDIVDYADADVKKEREKSKDAADFSKPLNAYDTDNDGKKDIAYITFDSFSDTTYENPDGSITYGAIDLLSGKNGANTLFNPKAKSYDSSKYDIKDVVFDISANSGGHIDACFAFASWLTGGKMRINRKGAQTGSFNKLVYKYDINGDKVFDEQDYLPDSVNVYFLTSHASYSAANYLPSFATCYRKNEKPKNKIVFMGARPGGGCCGMRNPIYLATGFSFYLSESPAAYDYADKNQSFENCAEIDKGFEFDYAQMVDRTSPNGINSLIVANRNK